MRLSKNNWWRGHGGWVLALTIAACGGAAYGAAETTVKKPAQPATNAVPAVVVIPKSVFRDEIASGGKDPFFPQSARRMQAAPAPSENKGRQPAALKVSTLLFLKGIVSGGETNKLALINNRHFAVGETNEVTIEGGKLVVQCLEIKEGSVVVRVVGKPERYELRMRLE